jgi:hypothetical protein
MNEGVNEIPPPRAAQNVRAAGFLSEQFLRMCVEKALIHWLFGIGT